MSNGGAGFAPSAYSADGQAITIRHDWRAPSASEAGLSPELVREMNGTADGFAANLASLKEAAEFDQPAAVSEHFDALSRSTQTKVFRELWMHPGTSFLDLLDGVEPDAFRGARSRAMAAQVARLLR
jgi:hypothetical protein